MQFSEMIGQTILLTIPRIDPVVWQKVKLLGVEAGGGLWVESQELTNTVAQFFKVPGTPKTIVTFWPYHEIAFGLSSIDEPGLDEKAFGL